MIVAIDGPAGAGKSSIARQVAKQLGFEFLDTGALYRAATLAVIRAQIDFSEIDALVELTERVEIRWDGQCVFLGDEDVSTAIRTPTVTDAIRFLADEPRIRQQLSAQQRRIAEDRDIVTEGRDQGAEVFPEAECKIFLTASPEERARRRLQQLVASGRHMSEQQVLAAQNKRDLEDRMRPVGRLRAAEDAVVLNTDGMTPDEVLQEVLGIVRSCMPTGG
ncbi:(d)CMP kinase [Novipirellula artificiosorum]|uniref:Cytidylate kinase n=1 Tax=Novipirellula artificiosorum TaxID=2528016 RepID=A0A5C6DUM9_9BACT|nr:(d)CMP kinase [Novipirellula artificiosorum]TWU40412.1 Cytidylate kinase [Novipirellula artificiosorum]